MDIGGEDRLKLLSIHRSQLNNTYSSMQGHRSAQTTRRGVEFALLRFLKPAVDVNVEKDLPPQSEQSAFFYSTEVPPISVGDYVQRILSYCKLSEPVAIYAIVLMQRAAENDPDFSINVFNVNRILITAVLISAKAIDGIVYTNKFYQRVAGIATLKEINRLELILLKVLDYNVFVTAEDLSYCYNSLCV